jgi:hypothetical protein
VLAKAFQERSFRDLGAVDDVVEEPLEEEAEFLG